STRGRQRSHSPRRSSSWDSATVSSRGRVRARCRTKSSSPWLEPMASLVGVLGREEHGSIANVRRDKIDARLNREGRDGCGLRESNISTSPLSEVTGGTAVKIKYIVPYPFGPEGVRLRAEQIPPELYRPDVSFD